MSTIKPIGFVREIRVTGVTLREGKCCYFPPQGGIRSQIITCMKKENLHECESNIPFASRALYFFYGIVSEQQERKGAMQPHLLHIQQTFCGFHGYGL